MASLYYYYYYYYYYYHHHHHIIITNNAIAGLNMFNRQVSHHENLKAGLGLIIGSERESGTWQL